MLNQNTPTQSALSIAIGELAWAILQIALRSLAVWFVWNLLVPNLFNLPIIDFGQAFILVVLVKLLFSNLNGYSKYQTKHLYDLNKRIDSFIMNQAYQNNSILFVLKEMHNRTVSDDEQLSLTSANETIDETESENYNNNHSENDK